MDLQIIEDTVLLPSKVDVLRFHLNTKLQQNNIKATESEMDVLMALYEWGGFSDSQDRSFYEDCVRRKYRGSEESVRNVITKFVNNNVILKIKKRNREINPDYLPKIDAPGIGLSYKVINTDAIKEGSVL